MCYSSHMMCENCLGQGKLYLIAENGEEFKIPEDKRRKRTKNPGYRKIDRLIENTENKAELDYKTLRKLYVDIANYCPRPLGFNGEIPAKIEINDVITLWCTEYSREDEYAIEQAPSIYYEAEINGTWLLDLKQKITIHTHLLDLLQEGFSLDEAVEKLDFKPEKQVKDVQKEIFKGLSMS